MKSKIALGVFSALLIGALAYLFIVKSSKKEPSTDIPIDHSPAATAPAASPANPAENISEDVEPKPESQPQDRPHAKPSKGHFEISATRKDRHDELTSTLVGQAREQKLWDIFQQKGSDLAKYVKVESIACRGTICTVIAQSTDGSAEHFQSSVFALVDAHPWLGNKIDVTTLDPEGLKARFVFISETPK